LKSIDDKASAEQGDIIVTEESAKKMQRVKPAPASARRGGTAPPAAEAAPADPAPDPAVPPAASSGTTSDNKPIRSVGPTFIPAR
jgi:hypothetical protein